MKRSTRFFVTALLSLGAAQAAHAFDYNETIDGDLSGDRLAPTPLAAMDGSNRLVMTSGSVAGMPDRDYFTFSVPAGHLLTSIFHVDYASADDLSFFALQPGTQITEPPMGANAGNLLGYFHFGVASAGTEIIDNLAASDGLVPPAIGFTPPLPAGNYAFWVQQTGAAASYTFDFLLVPEPAAWTLMLAGLGLVTVSTRSRRRRSS